ncbi:hypothetical protein BO86DRAFT_153096 [Aspergillus japonicus CBS 114.51]|uniref:Uncharacterized protein n=1 Tax=Aspergillus japonicus CBS 114.51 TaxID=1448312 RepID=A0A8T8WU30_ASPJA|nr:hypothetical protein BO86DRAFT_153096 [Aspergillus japonicus CBS 114.51]RAH79356.1 hypothetical protein BO86DRAFT_153096 [Aspergillus japonicus CBS 114.51]
MFARGLLTGLGGPEGVGGGFGAHFESGIGVLLGEGRGLVDVLGVYDHSPRGRRLKKRKRGRREKDWKSQDRERQREKRKRGEKKRCLPDWVWLRMVHRSGRRRGCSALSCCRHLHLSMDMLPVQSLRSHPRRGSSNWSSL